MKDLDDILTAIYRRDLSILARSTPKDVNLTDDDGRTPLMHSILAENSSADLVKLLLARGADPNIHDAGQKWTALHFAARNQNPDIVHALLKAGAGVDSIDVFGNTPLWRAVSHRPANPTLISDLLSFGADPWKKNNYDVSPMDIARDTQQKNIVLLFQNQRPKKRVLDNES